MKKLLVFLVLAAVAGALVYRFVLATPEARVCSRLTELCGVDSESATSCEEDLRSMRDLAGAEAVERAAECVAGSDTCVEATACTITGLLRGTADEVLQGIQRSLEQK
jgi:hypothetical protein